MAEVNDGLYLTVCSNYLYNLPIEEIPELERRIFSKNLISVGDPTKNLERLIRALGPDFSLTDHNNTTVLTYKGHQIGCITKENSFRADWEETFDPVVSIDIRCGLITEHKKPYHKRSDFKDIVKAQKAGFSSPAIMEEYYRQKERDELSQKAYA